LHETLGQTLINSYFRPTTKSCGKKLLITFGDIPMISFHFCIKMMEACILKVRFKFDKSVNEMARRLIALIILDDLKQYCDELENTAVWGGQLEVRLIHHIADIKGGIMTANTKTLDSGFIQSAKGAIPYCADGFPCPEDIRRRISKQRTHQACVSITVTFTNEQLYHTNLVVIGITSTFIHLASITTRC
jgi:hypothetical protein